MPGNEEAQPTLSERGISKDPPIHSPDNPFSHALATLQEKRQALRTTTNATIDELVDVYRSAFWPHYPTREEPQHQDSDALWNEIVEKFSEESTTPVSSEEAKEYLKKLDLAHTQLQDEHFDIEEKTLEPYMDMQDSYRALVRKKQELQNTPQTLSNYRRRKTLQSEIVRLEDTLTKTYEAHKGSNERYYDLRREHLTNKHSQGNLVHLKTIIITNHTDKVLAQLGKETQSIREGVEDEVTQDALFEIARERVIKPELALLVVSGRLTQQQGDEFLGFIEADYQEAKNPNEESSPKREERKQKLKEYKETIPGLTYVDSVVKGIQNKKYIDIFELLAKQEIASALDHLQEKVRRLGFPVEQIETIESSVKIARGRNKGLKGEIDVVDVATLSNEARCVWEVVRQSPLAQAFGKELWEKAEREIVSQLYHDVRRKEFRDSSSRSRISDTFDHVWSIMKNNQQLRNIYTPRLIVGLQSADRHMPGYPEAEIGLYRLLVALSPNEVSAFSNAGYPTIRELKSIVENHPKSYQRPSTVEWRDRHQDPTFRKFQESAVSLALRLLENPATEEEDTIMAIKTLEETWTASYGWRMTKELLSENFPDNLTHDKTTWALVNIRDSDRLLRQIPVSNIFPPEETREGFNHSLNELRKVIHDPTIPEDKRHFFQTDVVLQTIARQPQRFETIAHVVLYDQNFNKLAQMMAAGGVLAVGKDAVLEEVFSSDKPEDKILEIIEGFTQQKPFADFLFETTRRIHGEELRASESNYPITEIPTKSGVIRITELINQHTTAKAQNPNKTTELEEIVNDTKVLEEIVSGKRGAIPFSAIQGLWKEQVFHYLLQQSVELSRDRQRKNLADARNRQNVKSRLEPGGLYLHGAAIDHIDAMLLNGNLPGQVLGADTELKNFPFHTDFIRFDRDNGTSLQKMISEHRISIYGSDQRHGGGLGTSGQMFFVYDRNNATYEVGKDYEPEKYGWDNHRLVLGGMPSTETSAIILRNASKTSAKAIASVVENGFYIPIYDFAMNLIFTPEDFDAYKKEYNLDVPVTVWDYTFKIGEALGSHSPAGMYALPTQEGGLKKYYVKLAQFDFGPNDLDALHKEHEEQSRIWNEFLADSIYQHFGIPVPQTEIVKVNRTYGQTAQELAHEMAPKLPDARAYGHASEWIEQDSEKKFDLIDQKLKDGFIVDALIANWDVVKEGYDNLMTHGDDVIRYDSGGALLFRAAVKERKDFGEMVLELESMRASYPGLTEEDIHNQVKTLQERFKNEDIDKLVDATRLHQTDRNFLKQTLLKRRDYIIKHFSFPSNQN